MFSSYLLAHKWFMEPCLDLADSQLCPGAESLYVIDKKVVPNVLSAVKSIFRKRKEEEETVIAYESILSPLRMLEINFIAR